MAVCKTSSLVNSSIRPSHLFQCCNTLYVERVSPRRLGTWNDDKLPCKPYPDCDALFLI